MTNQNNAAQPGLTDDEILQVFADIVGNQEDDARFIDVDRDQAIRIARALLSKLRAPVADERAAFEAKFPLPAHCQWIGNGYAATEYNAWDASKHASRWEGWKARAALASAPVADEQKEISGVTLDGGLETLFRVGEHLGIDYAESRKQPGAPSGIYIKAIEDRVSKAMNEAREEAAKLMDQTSRSSGAGLIRSLASAPVAGEAQHPDDAAVDRFAAAMKAKLAEKRADGLGGWEDKEQCGASFLSELLRGHVEKGDPLDVGNFAMMLHQRGERIEPSDGEAVAWLNEDGSDAWTDQKKRMLAECNGTGGARIAETYNVPLFRHAAPQASAEYERGHSDGWAAGWDQAHAAKDGGQQRAGDSEDAARYRWATAIDENAQTLHSIVLCHGGDQQKINERADFYRAALSAQPGAQKEQSDA